MTKKSKKWTLGYYSRNAGDFTYHGTFDSPQTACAKEGKKCWVYDSSLDKYVPYDSAKHHNWDRVECGNSTYEAANPYRVAFRKTCPDLSLSWLHNGAVPRSQKDTAVPVRDIITVRANQNVKWSLQGKARIHHQTEEVIVFTSLNAGQVVLTATSGCDEAKVLSFNFVCEPLKLIWLVFGENGVPPQDKRTVLTGDRIMVTANQKNVKWKIEGIRTGAGGSRSERDYCFFSSAERASVRVTATNECGQSQTLNFEFIVPPTDYRRPPYAQYNPPAGNPATGSSSPEERTDAKARIRNKIESIWGKTVANSFSDEEITPAVASVVDKAHDEIIDKSIKMIAPDLMFQVFFKSGFGTNAVSTYKMLRSTAIGELYKHLSNTVLNQYDNVGNLVKESSYASILKGEKGYKSVIDTAALKYRSELELARYGEY